MKNTKDIEALLVVQQMNKIIDLASDTGQWSEVWDCFWSVSSKYPYRVEWVDMDTSYEEDIMARYLAVLKHHKAISGYSFEVQ